MTKLKPLFAFLGLLAVYPAFIPSNGQCAATDKPLKLAILANSASDFWTYVKAGAEKATQEVPNVSVEVRLVPDGTPAEQTRIFDDLLVKGTDGIAISPLDSANQAAMIDRGTEKAMISTTDSDAATSKRAFYVGTSNVDAGRQAGELIKKAIPDGGKIMIFVGKRDAQNAKERIQGLEEVLKGTNVSVIDVRTDDTDRVRARQNVADTLVKYPDIACLVGIWSYNGPAIVNSVKTRRQSRQSEGSDLRRRRRHPARNQRRDCRVNGRAESLRIRSSIHVAPRQEVARRRGTNSGKQTSDSSDPRDRQKQCRRILG